MTRRLLLAVATMLAGAGTTALAVGGIGASPPTLNLSVGDATPTTLNDLPELSVPDDAPETTTTSVVVATTTTQPVTTTSTAPTTVPTTVPVQPTTTTTTAIPNTATITVVNNYPGPVTINAGDENSNNWTLAHGETAGPWTMITADAVHGDGAGVIRVDTACGSGDGESYFLAGHSYRLEAVAGPADGCSAGVPAPSLLIHDLTTGTVRAIGPVPSGSLPTTG